MSKGEEVNKGINLHVKDTENIILKAIEESGLPSSILLYILKDITRRVEMTNNINVQNEQLSYEQVLKQKQE